MIFLQVLAFVCILILTPLLLVSFNLFIQRFIYVFMVNILFVIYTMLIGFVSQDYNITLLVFITLIILYIARIIYFKNLLKYKFLFNCYTTAKGRFVDKKKKNYVAFIFPLSFVKTLGFIAKKITNNKASGDINIKNTVDLFIQSSKGCCVDIEIKEIEIFFEVR